MSIWKKLKYKRPKFGEEVILLTKDNKLLSARYWPLNGKSFETRPDYRRDIFSKPIPNYLYEGWCYDEELILLTSCCKL